MFAIWRSPRFLSSRAQDAAPAKIKRDAFLYLAPRSPADQFAQCGTCRDFCPDSERCAILGPRVRVVAEMSCGLYVNGTPREQPTLVAVTSAEAGLVNREVRCENCVSFDAGRCRLYDKLNTTLPDVWNLDVTVAPRGCCNAQMPK